ncbi:MAG TPA: DUF5522 domain-containing protein [Chitinophagaceae bacterium]|nr:DUF5522 domain-containing protein [Chitinophagaceae bacterium]
MSQLFERIDYYLDKKGLLVFTEKYLLQRGTCCGNGCRHCPYEYKNVLEPTRSKLLSLREDEKNKT